MNNQQSLSKVIDALKEMKYTDEQIAQFCEDLAKQGLSNLYAEAMTSFTDEDLQQIENCSNQEEANEVIKRLYKERLQKDPDIEMQKFLDTFSKGFLDEHEKQKAAPSSS